MRKFLLLGGMILLSYFSFAQENKQFVFGKITDKLTGEELIGASIYLEVDHTKLGASCDMHGNYKIINVPIGRHNFTASFIGYKPVLIQGIIVQASKPLQLDIELEKDAKQISEINISAIKNKESTNPFSTLSSRSFTIEESSRFAGGLCDPSRVAYNFAGVSFSAPQDNGVVIRGNSPTSVLWRLNGIDVGGASHFGGGNMAGAGLISIYSSAILKGTNFYSGAFPAEYSNTTAGVFDINFREGNRQKHQKTFQLGILGADIGLEGPLNKKGTATYLVNYRHGFIGYYGKLAGGVEPNFKDLSYNLTYKSESLGNFSFWGMFGLSSNYLPYKKYQKKVKEGVVKKEKFREYKDDFIQKDIKFGMGAIGFNHKKRVSKKSFLKTNLGFSTNYYKDSRELFTQIADTINTGSLSPYHYKKNHEYNFSFNSSLFTQINKKINNKSGIYYNKAKIYSQYDKILHNPQKLTGLYNKAGVVDYYSAFTQFKLTIIEDLNINLGVSLNKFSEVNEFSIEPRIGIKWNYANWGNISLAYGKHSKLEDKKIYLVAKDKFKGNIKLAKAEHYVLALDFNLAENLTFKTEVYYQNLYDVPVFTENNESFINYTQMWEFNSPIVFTGTGKNKGIDFSIEKSIDKGLYFLLTTSIFDSKYKDYKGIERSTLFNRNFQSGLALGKEFIVRQKNILGFNININYLGGNRLAPLKYEESITAKEAVYDLDKLYQVQADNKFWLNVGLSYKVNKKNKTITWGLDFQNALLTTHDDGYRYNLRTNKIDKKDVFFILPNFYYKIEF